MRKIDRLIMDIESHLKKSLHHLEYSYNKVIKLSINVDEMDEEVLETWESFASRFARTSDIFLMKYLKAKIKQSDPGFHGTFRDYLNEAEKIKLIDEASIWMNIREIRNISAHDYSESNLQQIFETLKKLAPILLNVKKLLL